jgi:outer membrane protein insertion porin family
MHASRRTTILVCSALTVILSLSSAHSSTLRSMTIEGATVFTPREILSWLAGKPSLTFSNDVLKTDISTIRDAYRREGYLATSMTVAEQRYSPDSALVDIVIRIDEGKRTLVGSVRIMGATALSETDLLAVFDTRVGNPLDEQQLEQDIDGLIARYEKLGYALVACTIASLDMRSGETADTMMIALQVDEGRRVTIDEIRVRGNKETDQSVIIRETRLSQGEVYNPVKIQGIKQRLVRLNIFSSVVDPELFFHGERSGLLIDVREGSTNTFDGVAGYMPPTSDGRGGYLTGLVSVSMRNLFGSGRKLSVRWQREDRYSQELGLQYVEPWVFSWPVNAGFGFSQRQQDTSYVKRTLNLKAELMLSEAVSFSIVFSSENVIPSDSTAARVARSTTRTIGAELLYDTRDELYSPTGGARYRVDYHYGRKESSVTPGVLSDGTTNVTRQRLGLDLEFYVPTLTRQVVALAVHGHDIEGSSVDESELYRFGGTNSLRGYRENQFLASRVVWFNNEYRFLLGRRTFFYGFFDAAYSFRPADEIHQISQSEALRYGYGIGIRLDTALGNLGVGFAFGQGDSFSTAKVHIALINEF